MDINVDFEWERIHRHIFHVERYSTHVHRDAQKKYQSQRIVQPYRPLRAPLFKVILKLYLTMFSSIFQSHSKASPIPRLTPAYFMMIGFYATLLDKISSGPYWNELVGSNKHFCRDNWWTNLLYLNNFINVERMVGKWPIVFLK